MPAYFYAQKEVKRMIVKDGKNNIFEITGDTDGNCTVKVLDDFYFRMFYPQLDRLKALNAELVNTKFSDKKVIEKLIQKENAGDWMWECVQDERDEAKIMDYKSILEEQMEVLRKLQKKTLSLMEQGATSDYESIKSTLDMSSEIRMLCRTAMEV